MYFPQKAQAVLGAAFSLNLVAFCFAMLSMTKTLSRDDLPRLEPVTCTLLGVFIGSLLSTIAVISIVNIAFWVCFYDTQLKIFAKETLLPV